MAAHAILVGIARTEPGIHQPECPSRPFNLFACLHAWQRLTNPREHLWGGLRTAVATILTIATLTAEPQQVSRLARSKYCLKYMYSVHFGLYSWEKAQTSHFQKKKCCSEAFVALLALA